LDDLRLLREKGLREQDARDAVQEKADSPREAIAGVVKAARSARLAPPMGPQTVPAWAIALREAARMPEFPWDARFDYVAGRCMAGLKQQLQERYSPERAALDKFRVYDPSGRQAAALASVRDFIANMETVLRETHGLVLYGAVGTGKDHLLAATLYHVAAAGIPAAWISGEQIFQRIRDSMDSGQREETILEFWLRPTVLGISDPVTPNGALSEWDARVLGGLLDRRYRALRPTWLTMNAKDEADAKGKLTPVIWDRRFGRLFSLIFGRSYSPPCPKSFRQRRPFRRPNAAFVPFCVPCRAPARPRRGRGCRGF
jgi:DNA replication protein DnaC